MAGYKTWCNQRIQVYLLTRYDWGMMTLVLNLLSPFGKESDVRKRKLRWNIMSMRKMMSNYIGVLGRLFSDNANWEIRGVRRTISHAPYNASHVLYTCIISISIWIYSTGNHLTASRCLKSTVCLDQVTSCWWNNLMFWMENLKPQLKLPTCLLPEKMIQVYPFHSCCTFPSLRGYL